MSSSTGDEPPFLKGLRGAVEHLRRLAGDKPTVLYHYTSAHGLAGILETRALWASSVSHLNDHQELREAHSILNTLLRERRATEPKGPFADFLASVQDSVDEASTLAPPRFVVSFTKDGDDVDQWRGYGGHNSGFSLGLSFDLLLTTLRSTGGFISRCAYTERDKRQLIDGLLDSHRQVVREQGPEKAALSLLVDVAHLAPFVKSSSFARECEWRIVTFAIDEGQVHLRHTPTGLIPYIHLSLGEELKSSPISRIVVGPSPRMKENKSALATFFQFQCADIRVDMSTVPLRTW